LVGTSSIELEIVNFCQSYYTNAENRNKTIIPPYEIDIYLPDINLGIELNGIYWHSEISGRENKDYHQQKLLLALQNNVQLIQILKMNGWISKILLKAFY